MPRKWNLLVLILASTNLLHAQPLSKKQWKSAIKAYYQQYQRINTAKKYIYKEELFERGAFFEEVPSSAEIAKTRALVPQTTQIRIIDENGGPQLAFQAQISDGYPDFIGDQIDIDFIEANLKTAKGGAIQLQNMYQSGADGTTLLHWVNLADDQNPQPDQVSGQATYDLSFLLRYDQVKLSSANTGETFTLAGCEFKLIEVLHNQVILEPSCEWDIDLKLINWGKEGYFLSPYPYDQLQEMAAKDPKIDTNGSFSQSQSSLSKKMYQLLKQQPGMSAKQLRKALPRDSFVEQVMDGESYIVLSSIAPIKGSFTLFTPVYETDRVVVEY
ncbi:MAG: hypothetical protein HRU41_06205 [Saprospiraceae bacterium]|nr:hypothetical protein [Saprospiraceae bacterium]